MDVKRTLVLLVFCSVGVTGCSRPQVATTPATQTSTRNDISVNNGLDSTEKTVSNADSIWINSNNVWSTVDWMLKPKVPDKWNQILPQYNMNLAINQKFLYGKQPHPEWYHYNTWRLPESWAPYIQKNIPFTTLPNGHMGLAGPYLHITLQGTVFLERYNNGLIIPMVDVPVDSTVLAQYVPLVPALKAGIIPVWQGEEGYFSKEWQQATGISQSEENSYLMRK